VASIDVSAVTTEIAAQVPGLAEVGIAVLSIYVALAAFKWVKSALMGVESDFDWNDEDMREAEQVGGESDYHEAVNHPDEDEPWNPEWEEYSLENDFNCRNDGGY
jgi:hypothetical protein